MESTELAAELIRAIASSSGVDLTGWVLHAEQRWTYEGLNHGGHPSDHAGPRRFGPHSLVDGQLEAQAQERPLRCCPIDVEFEPQRKTLVWRKGAG